MSYMFLLGVGIVTCWLAQKVFRILNLFIPVWLVQLIFFCGLGIYVMAFHYHGNWADMEIAIIVGAILASLFAEYPSIDYSKPNEEDDDDSPEEEHKHHHHNILRDTLDIMLTVAVLHHLFGNDDGSDDSYDDF